MDKAQRSTPKSAQSFEKSEFFKSPEARAMRILGEYLYPEKQFKFHSINNTIIFFGSARIRADEEFHHEHALLLAHHERAATDEKPQIERQIERLKKQWQLTRYYSEAQELARMLTEWSKKFPKSKRFTICSGGGPGIMEAANRGAYQAQGKSIGLNISLPFEQFPNPYITPDLNFEFHYFFMRKFWFAFMAKALIIFPGGFGTLDELMELLTLVQTRKINQKLPILIYGEQFWKNVLNFEYLAEMGMISESDLNLLTFVNSPGQAFTLLTRELEEIYGLGSS
jgi:uncharacterized protein (TIGR00730 family)